MIAFDIRHTLRVFQSARHTGAFPRETLTAGMKPGSTSYADLRAGKERFVRRMSRPSMSELDVSPAKWSRSSGGMPPQAQDTLPQRVCRTVIQISQYQIPWFKNSKRPRQNPLLRRLCSHFIKPAGSPAVNKPFHTFSVASSIPNRYGSSLKRLTMICELALILPSDA